MKATDHRTPAHGGFTLAELMISTAVSMVALLAMTTAWIMLEKSYFAVDRYTDGMAGQIRALDYIMRDARCAVSTTVAAGTLTLNLPDYYSTYDAQGNPTGAPVNPTITGSTVNYQNAANLVTIVYAVANGALTRQVTINRTGTTSTATVCSGVSDLTSNFVDANAYVTVALSFAGTFRGVQSSASPGTVLTGTAYLRNLQR